MVKPSALNRQTKGLNTNHTHQFELYCTHLTVHSLGCPVHKSQVQYLSYGHGCSNVLQLLQFRLVWNGHFKFGRCILKYSPYGGCTSIISSDHSPFTQMCGCIDLQFAYLKGVRVRIRRGYRDKQNLYSFLIKSSPVSLNVKINF